jgi:hypothetical protein
LPYHRQSDGELEKQHAEGMLLKSAGFASILSDPELAFTLRQFCIEQSL